MKDKREKNIFVYLILKLLLAFGVLLVGQLLFYICNTRIFHIDGFVEWMGILWGNLVFGGATIAVFFAPFALMLLLPLKARWKKWYRAIAEVLYLLAVLMVIVPRGANMAYYQYTYRLLSDEIFSYLGISGQMGPLVPHFAVDYWYAWVLPLLLFVAFLIVNSRLRIEVRKPYGKHTANDVFALVVGVVLLWFLARGGFGHFLRMSDAAHYCQPKNSALVSNDSYNIFRTLLTPDLKEVDYMDNGEAAIVYPALHTPMPAAPADSTVVDSLATDSVALPRNVVLIILESFGQEFMGCYNTQADAETRTPFLDSLAQYSTLYDGRANGKKSIEGITAITTSVPNLMSIPLTNSAYRDDDLTGMPSVLKRHGYTCGFFHGSYNGVMDFDRTCQRVGFDEYLGMNEYNADPMAKESDYDGVWGIYDEEFLQYTAKHIGTYREPFLAEVFTVTSHHPFPIPEEHKGEFKEGRHPILKCVEYTDYALRRFFEEAQRQPWYNNTLFVICGDHSGHGLTREYNDYDGWYRIPMMIFDPQNPEGSRNPRIMQQTDLFPTLIDYLGFDDSFVCFGSSALQQPAVGRYVYYGNGYHVMVSNNASNPAQHDITVIMGDREIGTPEDISLLKALIQQYNHRVISNNLIVK